ncbi:MAG: hypothetical protein QOG15_2947 [Solirubrobacteraceae bacterium]|jgi:hypothetical protein|nr:hypothetical protein [Solirubrobacteraceae bacterium]
MPVPTFENVEPSLKDSQIEGRTMHMLFVCPVTGVEVRASAEVPNLVTTREAFGRAAATGVIGGAEVEGREGLFRGAAGGLLGRGLGRDAADLAFDLLPSKWRMGSSRVKTPVAGSEDHHRAVVAGFASVADRFTWEEAGSRWVCAVPPAL